MAELEARHVGAIKGEKGKSLQTARLLEVLSRMGVQLKPGVALEEVFIKGPESPSLPSRPPKSVRWEPFTGGIRVEAGEAAEGKARGSAERIAIGEARRTLGRVVTEAHYTDKDYIIERHGKPEAAIIGIKDYERLQRLENERDVRLLQKVKRRTRGFVSAEQLVSDYEARFGEEISAPSKEG